MEGKKKGVYSGGNEGVLRRVFARLIWYYSEVCFVMNVMLSDYSEIEG